MKKLGFIFALILSIQASAFEFGKLSSDDLAFIDEAGLEQVEFIQDEALADDYGNGNQQVAKVNHIVNVNSHQCGGQNVVAYNQVVAHCSNAYGNQVAMTTYLTGGTIQQARAFVRVNRIRGRVLFARRVNVAFAVQARPRVVVACGNRIVLNRVSILGGLFSREVVRTVNTCF